MNSFLLNRQIGSVHPQILAAAQNTRLLKSLQAAPEVKFALQAPDGSSRDRSGSSKDAESIAHIAGVSSLVVDPFEGRYLLSAGADSSVALWDLEATDVGNATEDNRVTYLPLGHAARTSTKANLGVTHISFYPFDSLAFLTSGYDHTLKLFSSETLQASATFELDSIVYSYDTSSVATHLLVACATQHPAVRLVDLRSGLNTHSLAGHSGSVLTVSWHPRDENILASGATDGSLRLWDIRRSASSLGVLDVEDSIGIVGYDGRGSGARRRERGRAHNGAVNGAVWTSDGKCLVSVGLDEKMRMWDMTTGANTLANFGPGLKNAHTTALLPLIAPSHLSELGKEVVYFPNPREILSFDLLEGRLLSRMRIPGLLQGSVAADSSGARNLRPRTTALAWRAHNVEMYSSHADGAVRCWRPKTKEDIELEREEMEEGDDGEKESERKRKREELDQIVRDLTGKRTTYS